MRRKSAYLYVPVTLQPLTFVHNVAAVFCIFFLKPNAQLLFSVILIMFRDVLFVPCRDKD